MYGLERFHECDTRIFAPTAAIGPPLIIGFRLQGDPEPLDTYGIARFIELHSRNANARVVALRDQPWKEVERTIRAPHGSRIQNTLDLLWIARLRLHHQSQAL